MPKRFSLVDCGEVQVVMSGFIKPDTLADSQVVVDFILNTSVYEKLTITVSHLIFNDIEGKPLEEATEEEVEILQEKLPEFYDIDVIQFFEGYEIELNGKLSEDFMDSTIE